MLIPVLQKKKNESNDKKIIVHLQLFLHEEIQVNIKREIVILMNRIG